MHGHWRERRWRPRHDKGRSVRRTRERRPKSTQNSDEYTSVNGTHDRGRSRAHKVRDLGKPVALALRYFESGADEVCLPNITSRRHSPLRDQPMFAIVREAASRIFVPLTISGGIKDTVDPDGTPRRTLEVTGKYFCAGADKVSIGSRVVIARGASAGAAFCRRFERTGVEAGLAAGVFHREEVEVSEVKNFCRSRGILVRRA
jgi:imidazole glycerol phosphate synthase subunit HisF